MKEEWNGFKEGVWTKEINVSDFIKKNYTPYEGNESFLAGPTDKTKRVLKVYEEMCLEEVKKHVIDLMLNILLELMLLNLDILVKMTM